MAMSCRVKKIDDDSSTEPYIHIHSLTLYFPHLTTAEEKELQEQEETALVLFCPSEAAQCSISTGKDLVH